MHLTFTSSSSSVTNLLIGRQDDGFTPDRFDRFTTLITDSWGTCKAEQICFDEVCVCLCNHRLTEACVIKARCRRYHWLMLFVLEGKWALKLRNGGEHLFKAGHYYSFHLSEEEKLLRTATGGQVLCICLTEAFMHKLVAGYANLQGLDNKNDVFNMAATGSFLNSRMQPILVDIMDESRPAYIRRILIEAKILELLSIQLHKPGHEKMADAFSKADIARLHEARDFIAADLRNPSSLLELARRTGLNDFKLKKGFKALFGQTVFGYLSDLRMEAAYNYLQNGKTVSEVAELIGYKNPHHFTAAFKKKFGFLPSHVLRVAVYPSK